MSEEWPEGVEALCRKVEGGRWRKERDGGEARREERG